MLFIFESLTRFQTRVPLCMELQDLFADLRVIDFVDTGTRRTVFAAVPELGTRSAAETPGLKNNRGRVWPVGVHPKFRNCAAPERNDSSSECTGDMHHSGIPCYYLISLSYTVGALVQG
jgi:hypothetical protein